MDTTCDLVLIAEPLRLEPFLHALRRHPKLKVCTLPIEDRLPRGFSRIAYCGNGEFRAVAQRVFGCDLAGLLWEIGKESLAEMRGGRSATVHWHARTDREIGILKEAGGKADVSPLSSITVQERGRVVALRSKLSRYDANGVRINRRGIFDYEVSARSGSRRFHERAPLVILASDRISLRNDQTLIPVTLYDYLWKKSAHRSALHLFSLGIDYFAEGSTFRVFGSYRNLFQDRAVGVHDREDPITRRGLEGFFGPLKLWPNASRARVLAVPHVVSVSCDGLPVVGPYRDAPGLTYIAGFGGKEQNFLPAIAKHVLAHLASGKATGRLGAFSPLRF